MTQAIESRNTRAFAQDVAFVFEKIAIHRAASFRAARFEVDGLCDGINIIYGPNAAGKTTLARAFLTLLWPKQPELGHAELVGHFRVGGENWRVGFDAGHAHYQRGGSDKNRGPTLAPADARDRYYLGLRDLIDGDNRAFADFIARESAGGYDVGAAADALKYSRSKRSNNRKAENARARLRQAESVQDALLRDAGMLSELEQKLQRAEDAQRRVELLRLALEFREADALHDAACAQFDSFPTAMAQIRGDEPQQFQALCERAQQAAAAQKSARRRTDDLTAAIERSPLTTQQNHGLNTAEAALPTSVLATLEEYLADLERLGRERATCESQLVREESKAAQAWELISSSVEPSSIDTISAEQLQAFSDLARRFDKVAGEVWAYKKLRGILTGANAADSERLEYLRDAARLLRGWLRSPADAAKSAATQQVMKWANIARFGAIFSAVLLVSSSLVWGFLFGGLAGPLVWVVLCLTVIAFVLLFLATTRVLGGIRSQTKDAAKIGERRDVCRQSFEKSGFPAPDAWKPDAVQRRLAEVERQIASGSVDAEKEAVWSHEQQAYRATEQKQRALRGERDALAADVGLNLDLHFGSQYILGFGDEAAELWWLISHIQIWQEARMEATATGAGLKKARANFDGCLDKFRHKIRPYLASSTTDAPDFASARAQIVALKKAAGELEQHLKDRKIAKRAYQDEQARGSQASTETHRLLERLQLAPASGEDMQDGDETEVTRAIDALCSQLSAYQQAKDARVAAQTRRRDLRARLEIRPDYDAALLDIPGDELERELRELSNAPDSREDILSQIARTQARVEDAKKSTSVEQKRADYRATLDELSEDLEANDRSMGGAILAEYLRRETRDSTRPAVFRRARELFASITHGRYRLDFEEAGAAQFRAYDTRKEIGQSLDELSSGTRVQLLLAVRVAFVEQQEQGAKLPLILDETLANSDDARAQAIIDAVMRIAAEGRQIFYFTAQQDEVQKWRQNDAIGGLEHKFIDLGAITDAPDFESHVGKDGMRSTDSASRFGQLSIPSAAGLSRVEYRDALGIEGALSPRTPIGGVHLWYLMDDPGKLEQILRAGISRWGALKNLNQNSALNAVHIAPAQYERLAARAKALEAFFEAWSIGRGRAVSREDLEASNAVSETFIDEVAALNDASRGDAVALLAALKRGDVKRFQTQKRAELAAYLEGEGFLDARTPLSDAQRWTRVLGAVAPEIAGGVLDAQEVRRFLVRAVGG